MHSIVANRNSSPNTMSSSLSPTSQPQTLMLSSWLCQCPSNRHGLRQVGMCGPPCLNKFGIGPGDVALVFCCPTRGMTFAEWKLYNSYALCESMGPNVFSATLVSIRLDL